MARGLVSILMLWITASGLQHTATAQTRKCDLDSLFDSLRLDSLKTRHALALRYAPVYWFSPGEEYFPTLPFFPAFDSLNNAGTQAGGIDFADPEEIAPQSGGHLSWNKLDSLYRGTDTSESKHNAIFYRVRRLDDGQKMNLFRYLKSDEQAWLRLDIDPEIRKTLETKDTHFYVIEYYAYYLNDQGLIGHPHDVEPVYVFIPDSQTLAEKFRVVVGAGHTTRIPNNVLVLSGALADHQNGEEARVGILVELGDHSSAPDVPPYGLFTPGLDANWHAYDVWGTRDVQASGGLGSFGRYDLAMTFPRDTAISVRLFPPVPWDSLVASRVLSRSQTDLVRWERFRYSLVSAEVFECLHQRLSDRPPVETSVIDSLMTLMERTGTWNWNFRGFQGLEESVKDTAVVYMRRWNEVVRCGGPRCKGQHTIAPKHFQPWKHSHYTDPDPTHVFKRHLFRPVFGAAPFLSLVRYWVSWQPGNAALLEGGLEIPAHRKMPFRIGGYLEVHGGVYIRCHHLWTSCPTADSVAGPMGTTIQSGRLSPVFTLLHTGHYNRAVTYYMRLSWITRRKRVDGDSTSTVTIGGGVSLVPASLHWPNVPILNLMCSLRLRIGLAAGIHRTGPRLGDARWEIQISHIRPLKPPSVLFLKNQSCA